MLGKNDITLGETNSTNMSLNQKSKQTRVTNLPLYKHWCHYAKCRHSECIFVILSVISSFRVYFRHSECHFVILSVISSF
jgi:hypothetical protein